MFRIAIAALFAILLSGLGPLIWSRLFQANLHSAPAVPWSALSMTLVIAVAWWLLSKFRGFRQSLPAKGARAYSLLAAVAVAVCSLAAVLLGLRCSSL